MNATALDERRARRALSREDYERYLPIVRRTAMSLARRLPSHVSMADLVAYGWLGLLDAFDRASPEMDAEELDAYAVYRIRGAALDYLRTLDPATRSARALSRKVARAVADLTREQGGRAPEEAEIAERLEMSVDAYRAALERLGRAGMTQVEMLDIDALPADMSEQYQDERASRNELRTLVAQAIGQLSERQQFVLALYYQEERTMREIGAVLNITESRVCQIHSEAIHRLRAAAGRE